MLPIIKVEGLSKQYQIGSHDAAYLTLREWLMHMFRPDGSRGRENEFIWALRDVARTSTAHVR